MKKWLKKKIHIVILIIISLISGLILLFGIICSNDTLLDIGIPSFITIIFATSWNYLMDYNKKEREFQWKNENKRLEFIEKTYRLRLLLEKGRKTDVLHNEVLEYRDYINENYASLDEILAAHEFALVDQIYELAEKHNEIGYKDTSGKWRSRKYSPKYVVTKKNGTKISSKNDAVFITDYMLTLLAKIDELLKVLKK